MLPIFVADRQDLFWDVFRNRAVKLIEHGYSGNRGIWNISHAAINRAWMRYQIYEVVRRQSYPSRARATATR